jgi:hypothetical protein
MPTLSSANSGRLISSLPRLRRLCVASQPAKQEIITANDNIDPLMYPPPPHEELRDCHAYNNLDRVVVAQNGVWAFRSGGGGWFRLQHIAEISKRTDPAKPD